MMKKEVFKKFVVMSLVGGLVISALAEAYAKGPMGGAGQGIQMKQTDRTMQQERKRERIHAPGTGQSTETQSDQLKKQDRQRQRIHTPGTGQTSDSGT